MKYSLLFCSTAFLLFLAAGSLQAAPLNCTAMAAVPPTARAEGLTEPVGDLILVCTGGIPTGNGLVIPKVNLTIFFNTNVTSRALVSTTPAWGEPLLLLDEPGTLSNQTQAPCQTAAGSCDNLGNGTGSAPNYYAGQGTGSNVNIFQGVVSGNTITFANIPLDAPGAGNRILRFTNIRVNAGAIAPGAGGTPGMIQALISASGSISMPISNPTQVMAFVTSGLGFSLRDSAGEPLVTPPVLEHCRMQARVKIGTLRYSEKFPTAFKKLNTLTSLASPGVVGPQNVPGTIYNTESLFFNPNLVGHSARGALGYAGLADWGTRVTADFNGIPSGVSLFVDTAGTVVSGGSEAARLTYSETGGYLAVPADGTGTAALEVASGHARAVWEFLEVASLNASTVEFGVYAAYTGDLSAELPDLGGITVAGGFAPLGALSSTDPAVVPRFVNNLTPATLFELAACPKPAFTASTSRRQRPLLRDFLSVYAQGGAPYQYSTGGQIRIAGSRRLWSLRTVTKAGVAGEKLHFRLPVRRLALRTAILRALSRGKAVTAVLSVTAVDALGMSATTGINIKVLG